MADGSQQLWDFHEGMQSTEGWYHDHQYYDNRGYVVPDVVPGAEPPIGGTGIGGDGTQWVNYQRTIQGAPPMYTEHPPSTGRPEEPSFDAYVEDIRGVMTTSADLSIALRAGAHASGSRNRNWAAQATAAEASHTQPSEFDAWQQSMSQNPDAELVLQAGAHASGSRSRRWAPLDTVAESSHGQEQGDAYYSGYDNASSTTGPSSAGDGAPGPSGGTDGGYSDQQQYDAYDYYGEGDSGGGSSRHRRTGRR